jgi:hypothetical protein
LTSLYPPVAKIGQYLFELYYSLSQTPFSLWSFARTLQRRGHLCFDNYIMAKP